jgi:plastocyanin
MERGEIVTNADLDRIARRRPPWGRLAAAWLAIVGLALTAPGVPAGAQTVHTVQLQSMDFVPEDITIKVGDAVKWEWVQSIHNVESGTIENGRGVPDGNFRSGNPVGPPATYELTFNQAFLDAHPMPQDRYPYYCIVHVGVDMKGSVTVAECLTNADCDDGVACTDDVCTQGACTSTPNNANCPSDGLFCNGTEFCDAAADCLSTGNPCTGSQCDEAGDRCVQCLNDGQCNDGNVCTDDACTNGNCQLTPNTATCDDNDECTEADACSNGQCSGTPIEGCCAVDEDCTDADPCTEDTCEGGSCQHDPIEDCGACVEDADCDDGNPCTDESCVDERCRVVSNEAACDDDDPCTEADSCVDGLCTGVPMEDCCAADGDCDDADECTVDQCEGGACAYLEIPGCRVTPEEDEDEDGVPDDRDRCPGTKSGELVDVNGCSCDQVDSDDDGILDCDDECPDTPVGEEVDASGCTCAQRDDDSDGVGTCDDLCPDTEPGDPTVDEHGCGERQRDTDGDGVSDAFDFCPDTPAGDVPDGSGCGATQRDTDRDGIKDAVDACPDVPAADSADGCPPDDDRGAGVPDGDEEAGRAATGRLCGAVGLIGVALTILGLTALRGRGRLR